MKTRKASEFLTVVLFLGILISFMLYIGISTLFIDPEDLPEEYYEYSEQENGLLIYNSVLYQDSAVAGFIRETDYLLFHSIDSTNVLMGKPGWLFEVEDKENSYNYLRDYLGDYSFSDEELAQIGKNLQTRRAVYEAQGVEYMMVVIPNSLSVCELYTPDYLGPQSENTRLASVSAFLQEQKESVSFLSLTQQLRAKAQSNQPLYNNTENSINAVGAYYVYAEILQALPDEIRKEASVLDMEDIVFSVRYTAGKKLAADIGMQDIIQNRTVSLTDNLIRNYELTHLLSLYNLDLSVKNGADEEQNCDVLLEFSRDWDKLQLMPLFSNTFDAVGYKTGFDYRGYVMLRTKPKMVIQVIRENELSALLDAEIASQYEKQLEKLQNP